MGKKALVLGGGGVLGISWETGVLAGLREMDIDATAADLIVGTSAGSVVGAQIAGGRPVEELLAQHFAPRDGGIETSLEFDLAYLMSVSAKWAAMPEMTPERCAEIGALALAAKTIPEERWVSSFEELVGSEWPERPLTITAVDAASGELREWDRHSGVEITRAVASSCAVPGLMPAVSFDGRRYTDGGVRSPTNADLARGHEAVLIVAPIGARQDGIDPLARRLAEAEVAALRSQGSSVELLFPDEEALEAIGINRMDTTRRAQAAEAGVRQGREMASRLAGIWQRVAAGS